MESMKVLSLGWGVQSFTLAAMAALGELEPIDVALHADTTHEASATYDFARRWTPWLEEKGVKVRTTRANDTGFVDRYGGCMLPAFLEGNGIFSRQCTQKWKRAPMRKWLRRDLNTIQVEMWLGISLDEVQRMRDSDVKYITHRWPLIEKRMSRNDCINWLHRHDLPAPEKSACVFCPFHSPHEWQALRLYGNGDFEKAIVVDEAIRKARPPRDLFLHQSRKPLREVDFSTPEDNGQLNLWNEECAGICGV